MPNNRFERDAPPASRLRAPQAKRWAISKISNCDILSVDVMSALASNSPHAEVTFTSKSSYKKTARETWFIPRKTC